MKQYLSTVVCAIVVLVMTASAAFAASATLETVKKRGNLICGVNTGLTGFSSPDDKGVWRGFDVDYCRAVSAAVFGNPDKVTYKPLTGKTRFPALQSGEIDVLSRNTTWTFKRDVNLGFEFVGVMYYDGQGFITRKSLGLKSAKELDGASVCIQTGTTTELNLADYFRSNKMKFKSVVVEDAAEARQNYAANRCDAYTTDRSGLAAQRSVLKNPDAHLVLPEIISKEPLGPVVRHGDNVWGDIARWVRNALIVAEELGITSQQRRRHEEIEQPRDQAHARSGRRLRQHARPPEGLGLQRHQGRGQLLRDLRAPHRPQDGHRPRARLQQPVDERRNSLLASVPLSCSCNR